MNQSPLSNIFGNLHLGWARNFLGPPPCFFFAVDSSFTVSAVANAPAGLRVENIQFNIGIHFPFSLTNLYIVLAISPCVFQNRAAGGPAISPPPKKVFHPENVVVQATSLYSGSVPTENRALYEALLAERRLQLRTTAPVHPLQQ